MPTIQILHNTETDSIKLHTDRIERVVWDIEYHWVRQLTCKVSEKTLNLLNDNKNQDWEQQCRKILKEY